MDDFMVERLVSDLKETMQKAQTVIDKLETRLRSKVPESEKSLGAFLNKPLTEKDKRDMEEMRRREKEDAEKDAAEGYHFLLHGYDTDRKRPRPF